MVIPELNDKCEWAQDSELGFKYESILS
jgi:hypothetical protein